MRMCILDTASGLTHIIEYRLGQVLCVEPRKPGWTRAYSGHAWYIGVAQMKFSFRFECVRDWMLEGRLFHGTRQDGGLPLSTQPDWNV